MRYNPDVTPNTAAWLALDEGEQIALIEAYHRRAGAKLATRPSIAIGAMLAEHMRLLMVDEGIVSDPDAAYFAALRRLSAASWRREQ